MNTDNTQKQFVCECGKSFDTQVKLSHHKTRCKVFQANKKQREIEEREARRLPNGLFKCDNPNCTNEHDGSYGSGRFCSKHCYKSFVSIKSAQSRRLHPVKRLASRAKFGRWKCLCCGLVTNTRYELKQHYYNNPTHRHYGSTLKGKTKENCASIAKAANTLKARYASGEVVSYQKGKPHTKEERAKISISMKKAHKECRAHNFAMTRRSYKDMSYPEKWFLGVIKNEFLDQNFSPEYKFLNKYSFDFAWVNKKKVIEIDGSQHYDGRFPERIQHDIERDIFVKSKGWQVLRLRWTYVLKQKKYWIKVAKKFIDG